MEQLEEVLDLHIPRFGPEGLRIRAVEPSDLEDVWSTMDQPRAVWGTLQLPLRSKEQRRQRFFGESAAQDSTFLGAELGGRLVGNGGITLSKSPRKRHIADIGMSVHDDYHGQGIGKAILDSLLRLADDWLNIHRVQLEVYTDNHPGIALYRSFGFEVEGTMRDSAFRNGRYVDSHIMSRLRTEL